MPELQIVITGKDEATKVMQGITGSVNSMGGAVVNAAKTATLALGSGLAAGLAIGIKSAGELEQAVANVSTIKPEIDTSGVFNALNEMTTRVPQSSAQVGEALYNVFSSVNVTQEEGLALVEKFAKGAVGAATDAETFGTAAMGVMNAYGLSVADADHISDVFFNTVNAGVVSGKELASSLGPVTQSAKAAGVNIDELGGFIAGVTKEGGPAAQNINNLNNFLQKITTVDAQDALRDLGVVTTDSTGKFRPVADVLTDVKEKLGGFTEAGKAAALQAIFPDAQARQGAQTLISQLDFVKEAIATNVTSAGSAEAAYTKMSATFNSQTTLLMNSLMAMATTVGARVLPVITPLITAFSQALPGALAAAGVALSSFSGRFDGITTILGDSYRTLVQVFQMDWSPDANINPVVNALGRIAVVIRDVVLPAVQEYVSIIVDEFTGFATAVEQLLGGDAAGAIETFVITVGSTASRLTEMLVGWAAAFVDWVVPMIPDLLAALGQTLLAVGDWAISTALPEIETKLESWGHALIDWVVPRIPDLLLALGQMQIDIGTWMITTALPSFVEKLGQWGLAYVNWVAEKTMPGLPGALSLISTAVISWIGTTAGSISEGTVAWGSSLITGFSSGLANLGSTLQNLVSAAVGNISVDIGPFHLSSSGFHVDAPPPITLTTVERTIRRVINGGNDDDIPGFALGGVVPGAVGAPMLAIVHGGETVVPPGRPLSSFTGSASGGGGGQVTIVNNIYGSLIAQSDLDAAVAESWRRASRGGRL